jgi:hypothetical protein
MELGLAVVVVRADLMAVVMVLDVIVQALVVVQTQLITSAV